MTLVQQITFLTFPLAALIAMFGGWFAYQLTAENYRDAENRAFMQIIIGASIVFIFVITLTSIASFEKLLQLGY
jgi:hypothetical protein